MEIMYIALITAFLTVITPAALIDTDNIQTDKPVILSIDDADCHAEEIRLNHENRIYSISMEEYLIGVVAAEMPASFEMEALKAQAVAARTFAVNSLNNLKHQDFDICGNSACCQGWSDCSAFTDENYKKIATAVAETEGEILVYEGDVIDAVYFSCSGGMTEDAVEVWGNAVPYLRSVKSEGEEQAAKYKSTKIVPINEFKQLITSQKPAAIFLESPRDWIERVEYTNGGGVSEILIGGCWLSGSQMRELFELNSTRFVINVLGDSVKFEVYGFGHRVGMSQYGANAMAQNGANYIDILKHYYSGVSIEKNKGNNQD